VRVRRHTCTIMPAMPPRLLALLPALALAPCTPTRALDTCTTEPEPTQPLAEAPTKAEPDPDPAKWIAEHYQTTAHRVAMRDGVTLFTVVYEPREPLRAGRELPILLLRTPYAVGPYGADAWPSKLGPHPDMMRDGYIF